MSTKKSKEKNDAPAIGQVKGHIKSIATPKSVNKKPEKKSDAMAENVERNIDTDQE